jgi:hypothetical protein
MGDGRDVQSLAQDRGGGWLAFAAILLLLGAVFHATAALLSIGAYPIWSVILLVVDGLILYSLSVYGLGSNDGLV